MESSESIQNDVKAITKIALHITDSKCGKPLTGLSIIVGFKDDYMFSPLGRLATDHVGYVSFVVPVSLEKTSSDITSVIIHIKTAPPIEIQLSKESKSNDNVRVGIIEETLYAEITLDAKSCKICSVSGLTSMQSPSITDWRLSPNSFSINPSFFLGADNCENLYPANFATQEFRFFQIVRHIFSQDDQKNYQLPAIFEDKKFRIGWKLNYKNTWNPIGHSLGQIVYSLPLAPAEKVRIAVIDWSRSSTDSRTEDTSVSEQLTHYTHRDRTITETVNATVTEWQLGGSAMAGVADSLGFSGSAGIEIPLEIASVDAGVGTSGGISRSLGGGISGSYGERDTVGETTQQLNDGFLQVSSALRELRSTVVIQSKQEEKAQAQTRLIVNYNHSHALTMLYYEVLRHFIVKTEFTGFTPCILVDYSDDLPVDFNSNEDIIKYRKILETVLLDKRYLGCFNAVQKIICEGADHINVPDEIDETQISFKRFTLLFETADTSIIEGAGTDANVKVSIIMSDDSEVPCKLSGGGYVLDKDNDGNADPFERGDTNTFTVIPDDNIKWLDIKAVKLTLEDIGLSQNQDWDCVKFEVTGIYDDARIKILSHSSAFTLYPNNGNGQDIKIFEDGLKKPKQKLNDLKGKSDYCCYIKLKAHLIANEAYYRRKIWLSEDINHRAARFDTIEVNPLYESLLDIVNNKPLDVIGNYVVFQSKLLNPDLKPNLDSANSTIESLMTLPTRGVFAEAKLGHCNASEIIDDTRFWDWQISPIPDEATPIDSLNINDSRDQAVNTNPSTFPNQIINIQQPTAAPNPTGLGDALNLLGQSNIFRDISLGKELEDLLEQLSNNTIGIAGAANAARGLQEKIKNSGSLSVTGGNSGALSDGLTSPRRAQNEIQVSENQRDNGTIDDETHQENVKRAINKMQGQDTDYVSVATIEPIISFGSDAVENAVSDYALEVLKSILTTTELQSATITSTSRTVEGQARIMYDNCGTQGVTSQKSLYGNAGDQIIDVYIAGKANGKSREQIIIDMIAKINELGPSTISKHINSDPNKMSVFDVAPSTIADKPAFIEAAKNDRRVTKFLQPPDDSGYHFEIPEPVMI